MKRNQITMIKCPICEKEYIDEEMQLVCDFCEPGVEADMLVADIYSKTQDLSKFPVDIIRARSHLLNVVIDRLNAIVSNTKTKDK